MNLTIFYAPQPDENYESSAAYEYARRASDQLAVGNYGGQVFIHRLSLDSLNDLFAPTTVAAGKASESSPPSTTAPTISIILLSCSADGSVDRTVRKIVRNLKQGLKQISSGECSSPATSYFPGKVAIALLGHAKCENSANQMKDTIFNNGRKFLQSVLGIADTCSSVVVAETIEIQVELEGPDTPGGFDDWLNSNVIKPSNS